MPPKFRRKLARFNRAITNPIQGQWAWILPPWAVICHRGRRSGRTYRTPVLAFKRDRRLAVAVLYGEESDWVRNVLAGGGQVVRAGRTYDLIAPEVLDAAAAEGISRVARAIGRASGRVLVVSLGDADSGSGSGGGFGRGPAAG
ncbi:MAG: nitroreductase family deazaflavin-dependent oxidoreductase [Actinomycetota bacterium]|nr:nitroreductase family deazaflavin-dependent oxidoreductase [Actinomycetota bacterium]